MGDFAGAILAKALFSSLNLVFSKMTVHIGFAVSMSVTFHDYI